PEAVVAGEAGDGVVAAPAEDPIGVGSSGERVGGRRTAHRLRGLAGRPGRERHGRKRCDGREAEEEEDELSHWVTPVVRGVPLLRKTLDSWRTFDPPPESLMRGTGPPPPNPAFAGSR